MHCKNCDYPLWNLPSRACPECGDPFKPSNFEFVPNTVQFCCPHCNQKYYGTNSVGHLVPSDFTCVNCNQHITMDEMVLRPAEGVDESQTKLFVMPWLNRHEGKPIKAWFTTVGHALVKQIRLMKATPTESSVGQAWWFAIITSLLISVLCVLPYSCISGIQLFSRIFSGLPVRNTLSDFYEMLLTVVIVFLVMVIGMVIWGAVTHLLLRITGGATYSIGRTYQAICYSSGANAISAIPCVGIFFGVFWWIVSAILMVKEAQKVSGIKATFATLTLPFIVMISIVGFYVWAIISITSMINAANVAAISAVNPTSDVTSYLITYSANNNGQGPDHAVQLIQKTVMMPDEFISYNTFTQMNDVSFLTKTLADFNNMNPDRQDRFCNKVAENMPENVQAHRVGDFVFTYHGIDLNNADPGLWIVVLCDDPDVLKSHTNWPGLTQVEIGFADGSVTTLPKSALPAALKQQNELRNSVGLQPLPDPLAITQNAPVVEQEDTDGS